MLQTYENNLDRTNQVGMNMNMSLCSQCPYLGKRASILKFNGL